MMKFNYNSISIVALFLPYLTKSQMFEARPKTAGFPVIPRHIAQTIVDFPVPFGPMITFRFGPGRNSSESYVLCEIIQTIRVLL